MRYGILSPLICCRAAAICARSRNCSVIPRCRPRRSIPASTASACWKSIAAPIRAAKRRRWFPSHPFASCVCAPVRQSLGGTRTAEGIMSAHESMEHAEHAEHAGSENKKIALLIPVIALCLALSETLGKGAQTETIAKNVEASNLWAFFQAKTIRRTVVQTATEQARLATPADDAAKAAVQKQIDEWQKNAARYR